MFFVLYQWFAKALIRLLRRSAEQMSRFSFRFRAHCRLAALVLYRSSLPTEALTILEKTALSPVTPKRHGLQHTLDSLFPQRQQSISQQQLTEVQAAIIAPQRFKAIDSPKKQPSLTLEQYLDTLPEPVRKSRATAHEINSLANTYFLTCDN